MGIQREREEKLEQAGVTQFLAHGEVEEAFRLVLENGVSPYSVPGVQMRAMLKLRKGQFAEAQPIIDQAISMRETDPIGWKMRGDAAYMQTRYEEAEAYYRKALAINPDLAEVHHDLGVATVSQGRVPECLTHFQRAINLMPMRADFHHHLAIMLLLAGQEMAGWDRMQWRLNVPGVVGSFPFPDRYWKGESLEGKTIVLRSEQGWGDTIMFARYLPYLASKAKKVYFYCQRQMLSFIQHYYPMAEAWPNDSPVPLDFDYHVNLMCLPRLITEEVPAPALRDGRGKGVGFCWFGSPTHKADHLRTVPVDRFEPLAKAAGQKLYSLGWGYFWKLENGQATSENTPPFVENIITRARDWLETAKIVQELDLVVTVDTAIAHLAAFVGVETWLLLPHVPDFRWGMEGERTKWYPAMKLYRQPKLFDWDSVFARVEVDLRERYA